MAASSDRDIRARISQLRREPETVTLIGSDSSRLLSASRYSAPLCRYLTRIGLYTIRSFENR